MLSIILAVYNGATTLPRTLEALQGLSHPVQELEIIAVDNASTDHTHSILESYLDKLPLTILFEPRRGKSFALNLGIEHSKGDFIIFTDDDVMPGSSWLSAYTEAADRHPAIGLFAGQVRHQWDVQPPRWLEYLADKGKSYGGTPIDLQEQTVSPGQVKGCNLMIRRTILGNTRFAEGSAFNFGGNGASPGGEDTHFAGEIAEKGNQVLFVPEACVRHIVRADQIGLWPVFSRYMRIGATRPIQAKGGITLLGYPAWGLSQAVSQGIRCLSLLLRGKTGLAATNMVNLASTLGSLREGHKLRNARKNHSRTHFRGSQ